MERFIEIKANLTNPKIQYLKSSMERFIGIINKKYQNITMHLKSSMERFIVNREYNIWQQQLFKIQYGEIYSFPLLIDTAFLCLFKIQYGEIYRDYINIAIKTQSDLKSSMERFIDRFAKIVIFMT